MKKTYIQPQAEYQGLNTEEVFLEFGASDQDPWAETKERGADNDNNSDYEDKTNWGSLW